MTPSIVVAGPQIEPISVANVAEHLNIDSDVAQVKDAWFQRNIAAARKSAENICRRALITQTRRVAIDEFPRASIQTSSVNWYGPQWGTSPGPLSELRPDGTTGYEIFLPRPPLQSVVSITYYDENNVQQTLDPSQYIVDLYTEPARITPAPDTSWPATKRRTNAVEITFICGYGDNPTDVPEGIRNWMLMRVGAAYDNREEIQVGARLVSVDLPFVDQLLEEFRVVKY